MEICSTAGIPLITCHCDGGEIRQEVSGQPRPGVFAFRERCHQTCFFAKLPAGLGHGKRKKKERSRCGISIPLLKSIAKLLQAQCFAAGMKA